MQLFPNMALAPMTTLQVGGPAQFLAVAETEADVVEAVRFAKDRGLPLFVLGGGSNLLVADNGYQGVVLRMAIGGVEQEAVSEGLLLRVGAGVDWDQLVSDSVAAGAAGIECLAGIPGTVGGTPVQNVGAYGQEVSETIVCVRSYDRESDVFVDLSNADCGFSYRTSIFNSTQRGRYIVTRVDFLLRPGGAPRLAYADLRRHFEGSHSPTLAETAEAVRSIRRGKGMVIDPADPNTRSAGSFFRNPIEDRAVLTRVADACTMNEGDVPHWVQADGRVKLPAAWLLERAGFVKGYTMGRAGISHRHTLAVINRGGATAADIIALRDHICATVRDRFGITLEQEPVTLG